MKVVNVFGEFSGKMGGVVWSRNRGGAYIRKYVTPLNPSSEKQMKQRYVFGINAQRYSVVDDELKPLWNTYANTVFVPLVGTGKGTGINAFVSLNTTIDVYNMRRELTSVVPAFPADPLPNVLQPPGNPAGGTLYLNGTTIYATIKNFDYSSGSLIITIEFSQTINLENKALTLGSGGRAMLGIYRSDWAKGAYKKNKFSYLIAATPLLQNNSQTFSEIRITAPIDDPIEGNRTAITLVLADEFGQQTPVDEKELIVPPPTP